MDHDPEPEVDEAKSRNRFSEEMMVGREGFVSPSFKRTDQATVSCRKCGEIDHFATKLPLHSVQSDCRGEWAQRLR